MKSILYLSCCAWLILSCSSCVHAPVSKNLVSMSDEDITKTCAGHSFSRIKDQLGLDRYPEHIMGQSDGVDIEHRYDLGSRWLFLEVNVETAEVERAFFVGKR